MDIQAAKIPVVLGSVREGRLGARVARMVVEGLQARGAEPFLIDPAAMPLPMLNRRFFEMADEERQGPVKEMSDRFRGADAIIMVTAEYNHTLPPALKNIIDHFGPPEFKRKPIGIVSYSSGRFGGVRAADALRAALSGIEGVCVGSAVNIPEAQKEISEEGKPLNPHWEERLEKLCGEIGFWLRRGPAAGQPAG